MVFFSIDKHFLIWSTKYLIMFLFFSREFVAECQIYINLSNFLLLLDYYWTQEKT